MSQRGLHNSTNPENAVVMPLKVRMFLPIIAGITILAAAGWWFFGAEVVSSSVDTGAMAAAPAGAPAR